MAGAEQAGAAAGPAPKAQEPKGPLHGLTVLDLSRVLAGPWASQVLGDLGAEIWKIERPETGDDTRLWGPPFMQGPDGPSDAAYYLCANRNKRSVAIDFGTPEGAALVRRLAERADILVENFKTGALARYGLDYASLSAANPGLIYCSVTGFGQTGPYASRGGYDFLIQGMSGLMSVTGRPDDEPGAGPIKVGLPVSDLFTGLYAATSILAALHHRTATSEGQHIDCALLDSQVAVLVNQGMNHIVGGQIPGRLGNSHPNVVPYREFQTADGHVLVACGNDGQFRSLCGLLNLPELAADPRFSDNVGRLRDRKELEATLGAAIRQWTSADFFAAMEAGGVPGGPINRIDQILADPQVAARGLLKRMERSDGTPVTVIGYPGRLSRTPATYRIAPQTLGEATAEVLASLGVDEAERASLREKGVIRDGR
ncbi:MULTISPECIES: CaiB/BaiF CoA transferase family protein [Methylobacterium]|uniref:CaiB/BaiF CoA transferase family protein n=1 Tax=Methylobacterium TaxID=407 RepID=UPI0019D2E890|nr:CaiB/BaiF CoA-transferase family protein [Methylobacterium sp. DB0501]